MNCLKGYDVNCCCDCPDFGDDCDGNDDFYCVSCQDERFGDDPDPLDYPINPNALCKNVGGAK